MTKFMIQSLNFRLQTLWVYFLPKMIITCEMARIVWEALIKRDAIAIRLKKS